MKLYGFDREKYKLLILTSDLWRCTSISLYNKPVKGFTKGATSGEVRVLHSSAKNVGVFLT
jgi:hypothetical protein